MLLLIQKLNKSIDKKERLNFFLLAFSLFISSITEILSIALIIPFISLILGDLDSNNNKIFSLFNYLLRIDSIFLFSIIIIFIFIFSSIIRLLTLNWSNKFAATISNDLVYKAYDSILNEDYKYFIKQSRNKLISIIHTNGNQILIDLIMQLLIFTESTLFLSLIVITLLSYNWQLFVFITFFLIIKLYLDFHR